MLRSAALLAPLAMLSACIMPAREPTYDPRPDLVKGRLGTSLAPGHWVMLCPFEKPGDICIHIASDVRASGVDDDAAEALYVARYQADGWTLADGARPRLHRRNQCVELSAFTFDDGRAARIRLQRLLRISPC